MRVSGVRGAPAAGHAQGRVNLRRRLPQHHDAGAHRPRHRGEGGAGRTDLLFDRCSAAASSSTTVDVRLLRFDHPDAPTNDRGDRPPAGHGQGPRPEQGRPPVLRRRPPSWRSAATPGFHTTTPPDAGERLRRLLARARPGRAGRATRSSSPDGTGSASSPPTPDRRPRRRRSPAVPRPPRTAPAGADPTRAPLGPGAARPAPGDKGGNANVGLWARDAAGVRLAARVPHRRAVPGAAARGRRARGPPLRAAQPAGAQLRRRRPARRGRRVVHPARPAGQGPRGVPRAPGTVDVPDRPAAPLAADRPRSTPWTSPNPDHARAARGGRRAIASTSARRTTPSKAEAPRADHRAVEGARRARASSGSTSPRSTAAGARASTELADRLRGDRRRGSPLLLLLVSPARSAARSSPRYGIDEQKQRVAAAARPAASARWSSRSPSPTPAPTRHKLSTTARPGTATTGVLSGHEVLHLRGRRGRGRSWWSPAPGVDEATGRGRLSLFVVDTDAPGPGRSSRCRWR